MCDQSPTRRPEASELLEQATEIKDIVQAGIKSALENKDSAWISFDKSCKPALSQYTKLLFLLDI